MIPLEDQPRDRKNQSSEVESKVSQQLDNQVTPDVVPDLISINPQKIAQSQTATVEPENPVNVIKLMIENVWNKVGLSFEQVNNLFGKALATKMWG